MKAEQSYYRMDRNNRVNTGHGRNNKIESLSEHRYLREMDKQLSEREVIARLNRRMAMVGLVLIPLVIILSAVCVVAQIGMKFGWW